MKTTPSITHLTRLLILSLTLVFAVTLLASGASGQTNNSNVGLEGTWIVRVQVSDPPPGFPTPFSALETYSRGGGLVTSNDNTLIPRPGQGAWAKGGNGDYTASILFFIFSPTGAAIGKVHVRHSIQLEGSDSYTGRGEAEFKDLDGNPLFPDHPQPFVFLSRGQRLAAE